MKKFKVDVRTGYAESKKITVSANSHLMARYKLTKLIKSLAKPYVVLSTELISHA